MDNSYRFFTLLHPLNGIYPSSLSKSIAVQARCGNVCVICSGSNFLHLNANKAIVYKKILPSKQPTILKHFTLYATRQKKSYSSSTSCILYFLLKYFIHSLHSLDRFFGFRLGMWQTCCGYEQEILTWTDISYLYYAAK